jgi:hypothetical protein
MKWWDREPAVILGLVQAAITVGVLFGLDWTLEQQAAVIALAAAILGVLTRSQVSPKKRA